MKEIIYKIVFGICKPLIIFTNVKGYEKIEPGCIVIAPHRHYWDGFFFHNYVYHKTGYKIRWIAAEKYYRNYIYRFIFWLSGTIKADVCGQIFSLNTAEKIIKEGGIIGIFPEGQVTKKRIKYKQDYKTLQKRTGAKIVRIRWN